MIFTRFHLATKYVMTRDGQNYLLPQVIFLSCRGNKCKFRAVLSRAVLHAALPLICVQMTS